MKDHDLDEALYAEALPVTVTRLPSQQIREYAHSKRVGQYLIGRSLGEGSFAKVKEGLHTVTGEKVAVKIIDKKKTRDDPYVRKNLRREGRLLQQVCHRNVVKLFEVMETENCYYLVMELCRGGDLMEHICRRKRLAEPETRRFIRQIISAVHYMHRLGILHRDLKVENLLLDENQHIKIIDFGLSNSCRVKQTSDGTSFQEFCVTQCGSPAYAAPELLGNAKYGPEVDVWSIGVNMFAMLTGNLPFTVDPFNIKKLYEKMINRQINAIPDHLTEDCRDLMMSFLKPEVAERITLAEAMQHPWIAQDHLGPIEVAPFPNRLSESELNRSILRHLSDNLDASQSEVVRCVTENVANGLASAYLLFQQKLQRHRDSINTTKTKTKAIAQQKKKFVVSAEERPKAKPTKDKQPPSKKGAENETTFSKFPSRSSKSDETENGESTEAQQISKDNTGNCHSRESKLDNKSDTSEGTIKLIEIVQHQEVVALESKNRENPNRDAQSLSDNSSGSPVVGSYKGDAQHKYLEKTAGGKYKSQSQSSTGETDGTDKTACKTVERDGFAEDKCNKKARDFSADDTITDNARGHLRAREHSSDDTTDDVRGRIRVREHSADNVRGRSQVLPERLAEHSRNHSATRDLRADGLRCHRALRDGSPNGPIRDRTGRRDLSADSPRSRPYGGASRNLPNADRRNRSASREPISYEDIGEFTPREPRSDHHANSSHDRSHSASRERSADSGREGRRIPREKTAFPSLGSRYRQDDREAFEENSSRHAPAKHKYQLPLRLNTRQQSVYECDRRLNLFRRGELASSRPSRPDGGPQSVDDQMNRFRRRDDMMRLKIQSDNKASYSDPVTQRERRILTGRNSNPHSSLPANLIGFRPAPVLTSGKQGKICRKEAERLPSIHLPLT